MTGAVQRRVPAPDMGRAGTGRKDERRRKSQGDTGGGFVLDPRSTST